MFGLSASHILIFGFIVLIFGSKRLPELGSSLGRSILAFKAAIDGKGFNAQNYADDRSLKGLKEVPQERVVVKET